MYNVLLYVYVVLLYVLLFAVYLPHGGEMMMIADNATAGNDSEYKCLLYKLFIIIFIII